MKVFDDFHSVHYEALKIEKVLGMNGYEYGKGATQKVYMFKNGYGASVINGFMSFGLDELAVLKFKNPFKFYKSKKKRLKKKMLKNAKSELCYDTPVTTDIQRYTDKEELARDLNTIANFKKGEY